MIVAVDARASDVRVRTGDPLELRRPDGSRLATQLAAIPHLRPYYPDRPFTFSLPRGIEKADVPVGTEVWASVEGEA